MSVTEKDEQGVRVLTCETWWDFGQAVQSVEEQFEIVAGDGDANIAYRGHGSPEWTLSSVSERRCRKLSGIYSVQDIRQKVREESKTCLDNFKKFVIAQPSTLPLPADDVDDEWSMLGRHHDLITNLLDWSRSPYVAAFFAIDHVVSDVRFETEHFVLPHEGWSGVSVWAIDLSGIEDELYDLRVIDGTILHNPILPRLHAQRGLSTVLDSEQHLDLRSYLESEETLSRIARIDITFQVAAGVDTVFALRNLERMGISHSRLFPDRDGAALEANLHSLNTENTWRTMVHGYKDYLSDLAGQVS